MRASDGWEKRASGFRVETASGTYEGGKLVFTAGAWAGRLVPEFAPLCQPERQTMLWTEPVNAAPFELERFPIFVPQASLGRYYGSPSDRGEGFKIGRHYLRVQPVLDPDRLTGHALRRTKPPCPRESRPTSRKQTALPGPVFDSLSDVRSSLVPRILTDPGGSSFIQSGVGSTAVTSCGAELRAPCGSRSSQTRKE